MHVTVCMLAILHILLSSSGIPQNIFSNIISQEHYQSVKRPGSRSVSPFWVQSVCKGNQQSLGSCCFYTFELLAINIINSKLVIFFHIPT